jgi:DNA topoisomerase-1
MGIKKSGETFLMQLLSEPETVIEQLDLEYVDEKSFPIARKRRGGGFTYLKNGDRLNEGKMLQRIKALVIPPAWKDVRISEKSNGHLQVVGFDDRGRKQYLYHPMWTKIRNQTKFYKMNSFGKQLPSIRKKVQRDLRQKGWPKSKVLALVIRLMEVTHIRIGGAQYARENNSYGLATLRKKHLKRNGKHLVFEFEGKKGIRHQVDLEHEKLVKLINQCEEIPGWELFQYFEKNGEKCTIDSGMVNEYIHDISGEYYTAKDFRTWSGSLIFFEEMRQLTGANGEDDPEVHIKAARARVAEALGNSRSICRKYYVHPALIRAGEDGSLAKVSDKLPKGRSTKYFSTSEKAMLSLLRKYQPATIKELVTD